MADAKISALTTASALVGTEVLPIVQSGSTKKVATNDLTVKNVRSNATTGVLQIAGPGVGTTRTMTVPDANFTAARIDAGQSFTGSQVITGASATNALTVIRTNGGVNTQRALILDSVDDVQRNYAGVQFNTGGVYRAQIIQESSGNLYIDAAADIYLRPNANVRMTAGNLVLAAGRGIDFSADASAAGMTSELLNDYEEGTWTPTTASDATGAFSAQGGKYTKVGNVVTIYGAFNVSTNFTSALVGGLPFTPSPNLAVSSVYSAVQATTNTGVVQATLNNTTNITFAAAPDTTADVYRFSFSYIAA